MCLYFFSPALFYFATLILKTAIAADNRAIYYDQLKSSLSSADAFQISRVDDWYEQCVLPFKDLNAAPNDPDYIIENPSFDGTPFDAKVSNYQLKDAPSGLCAGHLTCAYEKCVGPYPSTIPPPNFGYDSSVFTELIWKLAPGLDLPDVVVHPLHVGDVSSTIKFASQNKKEVSVKSTGHSYTGSSTKKGTILLHLSKLKKYSPQGSIVECELNKNDIPQGAYSQACDLARARNKDAIIRVGGGEIWDEVLRAVSIDWNGNASNRKYHIVSGAAGTVSAAGGWLHSGGLAGNNGMRQYGLGIDQVLHVEMVVPSGTHVRFGPTEWEVKSDRMYPVTTKVSGYCNKGLLDDEDSWDWRECNDEDIDFHDLWYAVRGGGGGAYGVVTSIYYQLHEYDQLQLIHVETDSILALDDDDIKRNFDLKWIEFFLKFFFIPELVGVTKMESNLCSSPGAGGFTGNIFVCFNGGGDIFKEAWGTFYGNALDPIINIDDYFKVDNDYESWAEFGISEALKSYANVPPGRLADIPAPQIRPTFYSIIRKIGVEFTMFPLDIVEDVRNYPKLISLMMECVSKKKCLGLSYIMGGMIPSADDGLNSLPIHRREGAFLTFVTSSEFRTKFRQLFYGVDEGVVVAGDNYPGGLCHNHASANYPTPLKEDWTQQCNPYWTKKMKAEKCLSFQETAWGTVILQKLEKIHEKVDPYHLFNCWDCVGYPKEEGVSCVEIKKKRACLRADGCAWNNKKCTDISDDPPTPPPNSSPSASPSCVTVKDKKTCKSLYGCIYSKKKGCRKFNCGKFDENKCKKKKQCEFANGKCSLKPNSESSVADVMMRTEMMMVTRSKTMGGESSSSLVETEDEQKDIIKTCAINNIMFGGDGYRDCRDFCLEVGCCVVHVGDGEESLDCEIDNDVNVMSACAPFLPCANLNDVKPPSLS